MSRRRTRINDPKNSNPKYIKCSLTLCSVVWNTMNKLHVYIHVHISYYVAYSWVLGWNHSFIHTAHAHTIGIHIEYIRWDLVDQSIGLFSGGFQKDQMISLLKYKSYYKKALTNIISNTVMRTQNKLLTSSRYYENVWLIHTSFLLEISGSSTSSVLLAVLLSSLSNMWSILRLAGGRNNRANCRDCTNLFSRDSEHRPT